MGNIWSLIGAVVSATNAARQSETGVRRVATGVPRVRQIDVIRPIRPRPQQVIRPSGRHVIEHAKRPAWEEKGWSATVVDRRTVYEGSYMASQNGGLRRFPGRIVQDRGGIEAYIREPPPEIKRHPKGPCFCMVRDGWFGIHWHHAPEDPDNAILYVETILTESLGR